MESVETVEAVEAVERMDKTGTDRGVARKTSGQANKCDPQAQLTEERLAGPAGMTGLCLFSLPFALFSHSHSCTPLPHTCTHFAHLFVPQLHVLANPTQASIA